jgi:hypothetical protein
MSSCWRWLPYLSKAQNLSWWTFAFTRVMELISHGTSADLLLLKQSLANEMHPFVPPQSSLFQILFTKHSHTWTIYKFIKKNSRKPQNKWIFSAWLCQCSLGWPWDKEFSMQLGRMKGPEDLLDTFSSFHYTWKDASTFHLRLSIHSGLSSALPPSRPTSPWWV